MVIVPCGHFGLCNECVDAGIFRGRADEDRPFDKCPACEMQMCVPWVFGAHAWLGGLIEHKEKS